MTKLFKLYEIWNTCSEYNSICTGRYTSLEIAKEQLKEKSDWYNYQGTGTIYEISFEADEEGIISMEKTIVFKR